MDSDGKSGLIIVILLALLFWPHSSNQVEKYRGVAVACEAPDSTSPISSSDGLDDLNNCYGIASPGQTVGDTAERFQVTVNPAANVVSLRTYRSDGGVIDLYLDNCKVADSQNFDCTTKSSDTIGGAKYTGTDDYMMTDGHYAETHTSNSSDLGNDLKISYSRAAISGTPYMLWKWGLISLDDALAMAKFKLPAVL